LGKEEKARLKLRIIKRLKVNGKEIDFEPSSFYFVSSCSDLDKFAIFVQLYLSF
jgi:hypothetical protein